MGWREYWEQDSSVYVNARHKAAHYSHLADDLLAVAREFGQPLAGISILDFGCGEALSADRMADAVARLTLCDGAARVRAGLVERLGGRGNVVVLAPEELDRIPDASVDLVVVNSVLQYVDRGAAGPLLASLARKLAPSGRMLVGDVLPPDLGALTDVRELISFASREGFMVAALAGLVRTALSDYARVRAAHGLTRYTAAEFADLAAGAGLVAAALPRNIGHNPHRLAFLLRRGSN